jgi:hypothetical protein
MRTMGSPVDEEAAARAITVVPLPGRERGARGYRVDPSQAGADWKPETFPKLYAAVWYLYGAIKHSKDRAENAVAETKIVQTGEYTVPHAELLEMLNKVRAAHLNSRMTYPTYTPDFGVAERAIALLVRESVPPARIGYRVDPSKVGREGPVLTYGSLYEAGCYLLRVLEAKITQTAGDPVSTIWMVPCDDAFHALNPPHVMWNDEALADLRAAVRWRFDGPGNIVDGAPRAFLVTPFAAQRDGRISTFLTLRVAAEYLMGCTKWKDGKSG